MEGVTATVEEFYRSELHRMSAGMRLPSERAVARELGTCRSTVRLVLTKLVAQKLVLPVHGKGYFKR